MFLPPVSVCQAPPTQAVGEKPVCGNEAVPKLDCRHGRIPHAETRIDPGKHERFYAERLQPIVEFCPSKAVVARLDEKLNARHLQGFLKKILNRSAFVLIFKHDEGNGGLGAVSYPLYLGLDEPSPLSWTQRSNKSRLHID